ncbi:uncharacterized protein FIESC28_06911 [Fusarium coffeatum]|uniref:Peptidase A1 domain-containing protein n=1 Tax=Fusarium coffeatum TaxID=231269 RepID=A0A366RI99_9HYPO|nr:uncharacterized protein FIESC28_06911 [Fusarium coffeatum]RBR16502.1 hypothetical protein FIESC28_06911 [Fusarium coffeatum]
MVATRFTKAVLASSLVGAASAAVLDLPVFIKWGYKMVEFDVGTPGEKFQLVFDTGSSSAWIVDADCAENCSHILKGNRTGYNISESSTGKLTGDDATIEYLGGAVEGPTVQDKLSAGGLTWDSKFIAANTSNWSSLPAAGFMGLGFDSITDGNATPIFSSMMRQKLVDEPKFGIYYSVADGDDTNGKPGNGLLTLGGSREDKYVEGDLMTFQIGTNDGDFDVWRSGLFGLTGNQGKNQSHRIETYGMTTVFDTGASSITVPKSYIDELYESIGMNYSAILSHDHVPLCSEFTKDWSVTFNVGFYDNNVNITVRGDQLKLPGFANRDDACWPPFDDGPEGYALIGTRFMRNFYTVWDYSLFPGEEGYQDPKLSFGYLKEGF